MQVAAADFPRDDAGIAQPVVIVGVLVPKRELLVEQADLLYGRAAEKEGPAREAARITLQINNRETEDE